ncbi:alpha/beta fold hydrolase [Marivirga sp. S37H4]|uniref:Alpha/beta fold hydrolase n=1 Tax=Marivirga aurantiaca TaxID=2802615 RepID=A0A934WYS2_9BACT|nr:alpha/beta fold hydrolase [Marivirga aurantiaca]MBK6265265.1 alpha/beta fold hydrolase [Marivirga aurantiaca]
MKNLRISTHALPVIKWRNSLLVVIILVINTHLSFAIDPDKEYILTPDSLNWEYEELSILTKDNIEINTWIYSPDKSRDNKTVLILAGPDAGNMSYLVYHSYTLAKAGFTVVTFDYRGFGKSSDFSINKDFLYYTEFSNDLEAVVNKVSQNFKDFDIGIWALSMGTTITTLTYPSIENQIDFIIGEGFVTNTAMVVERIKEQKGKDIILPESAVPYSQLINKYDLPILIFSASNDTITTTSDAYKLKEKMGEKCHIVEYEGNHLRGFQEWPEKPFGTGYLEAIDSFLIKYKFK